MQSKSGSSDHALKRGASSGLNGSDDGFIGKAVDLVNFDPIYLMAVSMYMTHLLPWQRLGLSAFTTAACWLLAKF